MRPRLPLPLAPALFAVTLLGCLLPVPTAHAAGCDLPEFAATRAFPAHSDAFAIAVGDFNGDGVADVASVNFDGTTVSIALGNGDGTLQPAVDYTAIADADTIIVTDLNGDGKPDLIVASTLLGNTVVLLGNGNGTFQSALPLSGIGGYSLAFGDLNGDGTNDVVIGGSPFLSVRLGVGNGTFGTNATYLIGEACTAVAIGDVNADGIPDIVVGGSIVNLGHLFVLLGTGNGNFQAPISTVASTDNNRLAIGDFNGDGTNDVAVFNSVAGFTSIFLSNGDGTLHIRDFKTTGNAGPILSSLRAVDLNHDGKLDLVIGDYQAFVLLGNGNGTLQPPVKYYVPSSAVADVGDFNADGIPDLVLGIGGLEGQANIRLLLGNGDGTFQGTPSYPTGHGPLAPALGDFNGDHRLDLVVANAFSNSISVLLNNGDGTFTPKATYAAGVNPVSIAVGDFNKDGKLDLIVANQNSPSILYYAGNGDGTFQPPTVAGTVLLGSFAVVAGDFDNDGKLDFAASGLSPTTPAAGVMVFRGNGNGTFQPPGAPGGSAFLADTMAAGDFNHDGKLDIVYTKYGSNVVDVILGNGTGGFGAKTSYPVGTNVQAVAVADLTGDGKLDLVTANFGCANCGGVPNLNFAGSISVLKGNGNGTFQPAITSIVNIKGTLVGVATGDFNGDGKVDVVVADTTYGQGTLNILLGHGEGTFQPPFAFGVQLTPTQPVVGDLDGDGSPDIVVANQASDSVSVLLNNCASISNSTPVDLALTMTNSPSPVAVSSNLTYTLVVTNLSAATAANVTITDPLPASVAFVSAAAGCSNAGGTVTCDCGSLPAQTSVTKTIVVTPLAAGTLTNTASVGSSATDPNPANDTAQQTTTVNAGGGGGGGGGNTLTPTLTLTAPKCKTKNGTTTCKLSGLLTLLNTATTAAPPVHVRFFLSTNATYDAGVDSPAGEATSKPIKAGKTGKLKLKATVNTNPAGLNLLAVDDANIVLTSVPVP